jgi:hypothetical protein
MGLIAVGAVVALAMMAQRYGDVIERSRSDGGSRATRQATVAELPEAEAERYVRALVDVRQALKRALEELDGSSENEIRAALRRVLARELADRGLDRTEYQEIESVFRAWQAGSPDVPRAFDEALGRRADDLSELDLGSYDPLAL